MKQGLATKAVEASAWRTIQLGGVEGIYLVRLLVLARLLHPEDFGLVAIGIAAVGLVVNISNLDLVSALVQRSESNDDHFHSAWTIGFVRGLLIASVMFLAAPFIAELFGEPRATDIIRLIGLRPLLESGSSIKVANLTRQLRFRSLAAIRIPSALADTSVAILLAPFIGYWALVAGTLFGSLASLVLSYILAPYRPRLSLDLRAALPLIRFGKWILAGGVLGVATGTVIQMIISRKLGASALGLYSLGISLGFLPYKISTEVIGAVAFPVFSRLQYTLDRASEAFRAIFVSMTSTIFPLYGLLFALAPTLTDGILGSKWAGTAPIVQVISLVGMTGLFGDTVLPVLKGLGRPEKTVWIGLARTVVILACVLTLTDRFGVVGAAMSWVPAIAVAQGMAAWFLTQMIPRPMTGMGRLLGTVTVVTGFSVLTARQLSGYFEGIAGLLLSATAALAVYGTLLWIVDVTLKLHIIKQLERIFAPLLKRALALTSNIRAIRRS